MLTLAMPPGVPIASGYDLGSPAVVEDVLAQITGANLQAGDTIGITVSVAGAPNAWVLAQAIASTAWSLPGIRSVEPASDGNGNAIVEIVETVPSDGNDWLARIAEWVLRIVGVLGSAALGIAAAISVLKIASSGVEVSPTPSGGLAIVPGTGGPPSAGTRPPGGVELPNVSGLILIAGVAVVVWAVNH